MRWLLRSHLGRLLLVLATLFFARDTTAHKLVPRRPSLTTPFAAGARQVRRDSWAVKLPPVAVKNVATHETVPLRLYAETGSIDEAARTEFERIAARDCEPHILAERLEQLVFKAAYHFGAARIDIVSGWRDRARKHTSGEALDFSLPGVLPHALAAYLRGLAHVGVGIYTHPNTQFVHLDVRDQSYHWVDSSAPGGRPRERWLRDPQAEMKDAAWHPQNDLPE
jgi:uncharacterized protein YcbK (DUF882 family)